MTMMMLGLRRARLQGCSDWHISDMWVIPGDLDYHDPRLPKMRGRSYVTSAFRKLHPDTQAYLMQSQKFRGGEW